MAALPITYTEMFNVSFTLFVHVPISLLSTILLCRVCDDSSPCVVCIYFIFFPETPIYFIDIIIVYCTVQ